MRLFNKIFFGAAAIAVTGAFSSCKEEATLSGADAVYIEMANTNMTMLIGDTLKLSARVSNVSGKDINTPISWSVGDESIVKIVDVVEYTRVKNPNYSPSPSTGGETTDPGSPGDGDDSGSDADESTTSRSDAADDGESSTEPDNSQQYIIEETHYVGVTPVEGAQGKSTTIMATLENGQFALTTVTVGRNTLSGAITVSTGCADESVLEDRNSVNKTTYISTPNDAVWFDVNPIQLINDYELSYDFELIEVVSEGDSENELDFVFPDDPVEIDLKNGQVGIRFTAPRIAGKAKITLTLSLRGDDGEITESESCSNEILIFPTISGGFEYESNGEIIRPGYGPPTPSNIKPTMITVTMDINSSHLVGVCMGVQSGRADDIRNAMAAESAGYFTWTLDGSAVVLEDQFFDEDYESGYVTYLNVRSGIRSGAAKATFKLPGAEEDFVCDITVEDYNKVHPVTDILIQDADGDVDLDNYVVYLGQPMALEVSTVPDASFTYHIPEITSSDPSILRVEERGSADGYVRRFTALRTGTVTLTFTSLDVVKTMQVTVEDALQRVVWNNITGSLITGSSADLSILIYMQSDINNALSAFNGEISWSSSDPSVLTVAADPANPMKAVVTGVTDGTATVSVRVSDGVFSQTIENEISVVSLTGKDYNNNMVGYSFSYLVDADYGANTIMVSSLDGDDYFDMPYSAAYAGSFSGSDGAVQLGQADPVEGAAYNLTIVDNGDGTVTINGYFEANGARYTFTNLVCELQV